MCSSAVGYVIEAVEAAEAALCNGEISSEPSEAVASSYAFVSCSTYTVMKILEIAYPKHWILLEVSKYLGEHLMQIDLLMLSN